MSVIELLFSPFGRVNRKTFWLVCSLCCLPGIILAYLDEFDSEALYRNSLVIYLVILGLCLNWPFYVIQIKRWHDRNKSGWWCLVNFVPLIGPMWSLIELGFLKGSPRSNYYGESQQTIRSTERANDNVVIMSDRMKQFCYKQIHELGNAFNHVLLQGIEYEEAFDIVMRSLGVIDTKRKDLIYQTLIISNMGSIPYKELSPLNQFIVSIPPYVYYCLQHKLPDDESLRQEAQSILYENSLVLPSYLQKEIGFKVSQKIGGALYLVGGNWLSIPLIKTILIVFGICISGLMYLYQEHVFFRVSAYSAGIVLVLLWLKYLSVGRIYTRVYGSVHCLNIWQFNILPILTAICLFVTGNILFLPLMVFFWLLPNFLALLSHEPFMQQFVPYILSIVYGWYIGVSFGGLFNATSPFWKISSGILGVLIIQVVCSLILNYITGLYDKAEHMDDEPQQCEGFKTFKYKRRILIINDERNIVQTLKDRFEMNDFDVEAAYDNDTALCLIQKRKYDLIMQNMNRPFGNCLVDSNEKWAGVAFYRKYICTISPEVPVIFYSAHIHELPKDILKPNLCTGLTIPFDLTELLVLIESILDEQEENLRARRFYDEEFKKTELKSSCISFNTLQSN